MIATRQLIDLADSLHPSGEIGDGTVATFHALAAQARKELERLDRERETRAQYDAECG